MTLPLTVQEHDDVAVDAAGGAACLSHREAHEATRIALRRPGFCVRGFRSVRFAQYSGIVNLGPRTVEILPKVEERERAAEECRDVFLRLLGLAEGLRLTRMNAVGQSTRKTPLLEIFIAAFFEELSGILQGGLLRRYREENDDLPLLRGRLLLHQQIRRHALRYDRLACQFDELRVDNDWNRVLKAGLSAVRPWLASARLKRRWSELWPAFDEVSQALDPACVFERLSPDRQVARYAHAVRWARWMVALTSPSLRAGNAGAPGLLFDTNVLFERAIAHHLRARCDRHPDRPHLVTQDTSTYLAEFSGTVAHAAVPVRPDLLLRTADGIGFVADTKWKRVSLNRHGYLEPSTQDVHQLLAYATAFRCADVALIYPWHDGLGAARETVLRMTSFSGDVIRLHILVVDVSRQGLPVRLGRTTPWLGDLLGASTLD
jgi:5-methylcytosine-specific restriction enzyme subunit McrC